MSIRTAAVFIAFAAALFGGTLILYWLVPDPDRAIRILNLVLGSAMIMLGLIGPQQLRRWVRITEHPAPDASRKMFAAGWRLMLLLIGSSQLLYASEIRVLPKDLQATLVFAVSSVGSLIAFGLVVASEAIARRDRSRQPIQ